MQKSGFKIDREPTDTVPKQTSSMFFSDPEKSMCQKTKATKHVSTPPISPSQKVIIIRTTNNNDEQTGQIFQSVLECAHGRKKRFAQKPVTQRSFFYFFMRLFVITTFESAYSGVALIQFVLFVFDESKRILELVGNHCTMVYTTNESVMNGVFLLSKQLFSGFYQYGRRIIAPRVLLWSYRKLGLNFETNFKMAQLTIASLVFL